MRPPVCATCKHDLAEHPATTVMADTRRAAKHPAIRRHALGVAPDRPRVSYSCTRAMTRKPPC